MSEVMVGDQVLVAGTALKVIPGVGVLVELFSKTDQYQGWIREDLVHLPAKSVDVPAEPADGTTLMGDIDPETGNGSIFRHDMTEGHCDDQRRYDRAWWDYAASEWIDWPAALRRGANPGRRLTEEPAAGDRGDSRVAGLGEWVQGACGCIWREHRPPGLAIDPAEPRVCSACPADHPASVRPSPQGMAMVPVTYHHHRPGIAEPGRG